MSGLNAGNTEGFVPASGTFYVNTVADVAVNIGPSLRETEVAVCDLISIENQTGGGVTLSVWLEDIDESNNKVYFVKDVSIAPGVIENFIVGLARLYLPIKFDSNAKLMAITDDELEFTVYGYRTIQ